MEKWLNVYYGCDPNKRSEIECMINPIVDPIYLRDLIYSDNFEKVSGYSGPFYPQKEKVFAAFDMIAPSKVKVVILGQDPYHTPGQAQGLAFSLPDGAPTQPSMRNILKELKDDLGIERTSRDLTGWAKQGVLLLNTSLTVEEGQPNGMADVWLPFTTRLIENLSKQDQTIIFVLWGKQAQKFAEFIDEKQPIISSAHPSPFSARRGFFGSKPFSKVNEILRANNLEEIDWGE